MDDNRLFIAGEKMNESLLSQSLLVFEMKKIVLGRPVTPSRVKKRCFWGVVRRTFSHEKDALLGPLRCRTDGGARNVYGEKDCVV